MAEKFRSRKGAAAYVTERGLPCAAATLQKLASVGGGPRYRRFGNRAVYTDDDLDAWIEQRLTAPMESSSTSAAAPGRG